MRIRATEFKFYSRLLDVEDLLETFPGKELIFLTRSHTNAANLLVLKLSL
jgi:hypothetical protein